MRVLILTGAFGAGHLSASIAISEQLRDTFDDCNVKIVDLFRYMMPKAADTVYKAYGKLAVSHNSIYNLLIELGDIPSVLPGKSIFINRFGRLIDEYRPDVLISTWPIGAEYIGEYKRKSGIKAVFITCITDILVSRAWMSDMTDAYLVGDEAVKDSLVIRGVDAKKIFITGIPVKREFQCSGTNIHNENKFRILIMGGGLGMMNGISDTLRELSENDDIEVTVITGNNKKLHDTLRSEFPSVNIIGYTENVAKFMKSSDCIITKAGGITLFEAIWTGTPIIAVRSGLTQERYNLDFIARRSIGAVTEMEGGSAAETVNYLIAEGRLGDIRSSMREFVKSLDKNALQKILSKAA